MHAGLVMSGMICVKFHTALVVAHKGEEHLITDGPSCAKHYLWEGTGLVDIVTTIPFAFQVPVIDHRYSISISSVFMIYSSP